VYGLTNSNNMNKRKTILLNRLNETDLEGVIKIKRELKKMLISTSSTFFSTREDESKLFNEEVLERIKLIDDYLMDNYSDEVKDFIEYGGEIIKNSDVLVMVWEDKWCRDEGINDKMDGSDFESTDFQSLIDSIKEYYVGEIKRKRGCIEVEVNGKSILHISPDSKNKWEVIK
jgi:urease gamma subunit